MTSPRFRPTTKPLPEALDRFVRDTAESVGAHARTLSPERLQEALALCCDLSEPGSFEAARKLGYDGMIHASGRQYLRIVRDNGWWARTLGAMWAEPLPAEHVRTLFYVGDCAGFFHVPTTRAALRSGAVRNLGGAWTRGGA